MKVDPAVKNAVEAYVTQAAKEKELEPVNWYWYSSVHYTSLHIEGWGKGGKEWNSMYFELRKAGDEWRLIERPSTFGRTGPCKVVWTYPPKK